MLIDKEGGYDAVCIDASRCNAITQNGNTIFTLLRNEVVIDQGFSFNYFSFGEPTCNKFPMLFVEKHAENVFFSCLGVEEQHLENFNACARVRGQCKSAIEKQLMILICPLCFSAFFIRYSNFPPHNMR